MNATTADLNINEIFPRTSVIVNIVNIMMFISTYFNSKNKI